VGDCGGFGVRSNVWPGGLVCLRGDLGEEAFVGGGNCFGEYGKGAGGSYIVDGQGSSCIRR